MRRFFLGLLLLSLSGALVGAVMSWPTSAVDPQRTSPTLTEFQTGVRVSQLSGTPNRPSLELAAEPEQMPGNDTHAAELLAHPVGEPDNRPDHGSDASGQPSHPAAAESQPRMVAAGDDAPGTGPPQSAAPPDVHRQEDRPTEPVVLRSAVPAQAVTEVVAKTAADTPTPGVSARSPANTDVTQQRDMTAETPARAPGKDKQPAQTSNGLATDVPHQMPMTGRHVEHVSIHYRGDARSRTNAQQLSSQLKSAGVRKVEMHTTAHSVSSPLVRYFSQQDAPAANSLAKWLESRTSVWRVEDCTAYRHKPAAGTVQVWLTTTAASTSLAARGPTH
jgi:hypothetical protein